MPLPFDATNDELVRRIDEYIDEVMASLESEFLVMPRGPGFVEYARFSAAYEVLRRSTGDFSHTADAQLSQAVDNDNLVLVVIRSILGFTPSEWAHLATRSTGVRVDQGFCRNLDRKVRLNDAPTALSRADRVRALLTVASELLNSAVPTVEEGMLHRLDKADTRDGWASVQHSAALGTPYAMLLYERFLGRPFAGHRDSVSELVGGGLETAIEQRLSHAHVLFRKTRRAERIPGFDQAPDFIVPDEFNPRIVIEAKLTEDDGTARDKVTRVQHLAQLAEAGQPEGSRAFEVIAVIAGRGFSVRREDMKKLLLATRGKVFTLKTLDHLVSSTNLADFAA